MVVLPGRYTTACYNQSSEVSGISHLIMPNKGHGKRNYISQKVFDWFSFNNISYLEVNVKSLLLYLQMKTA